VGKPSTEVLGELRTCPNDGEPVIFTFKYPGHEYVCTVCGWLGGVLGTPTSQATPERVARAAELLAAFNAENGVTPEPDLPEHPKCKGCDAVAPTPHKPPHWYTRTIGGVTEYACSRAHIDGGTIAPW
jgi:hypothetical protein